jgi:hypothetical protein
VSKNEKVSDLSDIHGYFTLARIVGILFAAVVVALIILTP